MIVKELIKSLNTQNPLAKVILCTHTGEGDESWDTFMHNEITHFIDCNEIVILCDDLSFDLMKTEKDILEIKEDY